MTQIPPRSDMATHEVHNQPALRGDSDLWQNDPVLRQIGPRMGVQTDTLAPYGQTLGTAEMRDAARDANDNIPQLDLFDRGGRRLDAVRFHPSYHRFMEISASTGYSAVAWEKTAGGHATHAAMVYLASQVEPGHCCPLTMTYAAAPVLAAADGIARDWCTKTVSRHYDPSTRPIGEKTAATIGMAMTEKQGGSDVRANTTTAEADGDTWRLTGHKWFCSAPMSDGFLTLAQAPGGLTCFLVPRWLEGARNAVHLQRLKAKLGNRSNASAEIEYNRALAYRIGDVGRGVNTIVEMVHHTRLDTAIAPAGLMRAALVEAHHWVTHRTAFQKNLIDQPLMCSVLADLALDWEGSLALGLWVASAFDGDTEEDRAFARIGVALAKFMSNKLCPLVVGEAMEILGGMGYVDDTPLPMLYREAPLNGIWEGSGNVICLDALRSLAKDPRIQSVLTTELDAVQGRNTQYDTALADYRTQWPRLPDEAEARWFVERTALLLTASVLMRHAPEAVADAYVQTRLTGEKGRIAGAGRIPNISEILARLGPAT